MKTTAQCEGWWEQNVYGRQPMSPLTLTFTDGEIQGSGNDIVGPFTMTGTMRDGQVVIHKQYLGKHATKYIGQFDGEGSMQGSWHIGDVTGPWGIRYLGKPTCDDNIADIRDL